MPGRQVGSLRRFKCSRKEDGKGRELESGNIHETQGAKKMHKDQLKATRQATSPVATLQVM